MAQMYRVRTVFTGVPGTPWYSNLYFATEGGTIAQARAAASSLFGDAVSLLSSAVAFNVDHDVAIIEAETGQVVGMPNDPENKGAVGGSGANRLPIATQMLIRATTGAYIGGKQIRGRVFFPGLTVSSDVDGAPSNAAKTTLQTAVNTLIAQPNAQWVVWSKKNGSYAVVNGGSVWDKFAVLRSRRD